MLMGDLPLAPGLGRSPFLSADTTTDLVPRSWYDSSREIRFFQDGSGEVTFGNVTVYEGLYDAWPGRT